MLNMKIMKLFTYTKPKLIFKHKKYKIISNNDKFSKLPICVRILKYFRKIHNFRKNSNSILSSFLFCFLSYSILIRQLLEMIGNLVNIIFISIKLHLCTAISESAAPIFMNFCILIKHTLVDNPVFISS